MRITGNMLCEYDACRVDIEKFETQWPDGCEVTEENCIIAFTELNFSPSWAARNLLSYAARVEYLRLKNIVWEEHGVLDKAYWTNLAIAFFKSTKLMEQKEESKP